MDKLERQEKFKTWLSKMGAVVQDTTNIYELVRFKTVNGVSVVYTGKKGITFTGESELAYEKFMNGKPWRVVNRKRKQLRDKKARLAARDGKRCFAHGEKMNFDDLTIEHILSFSHGGTDNENNLCLACEPCQRALGNLPITKKIRIIAEKRQEFFAKEKVTKAKRFDATNDGSMIPLQRIDTGHLKPGCNHPITEFCGLCEEGPFHV